MEALCVSAKARPIFEKLADKYKAAFYPGQEVDRQGGQCFAELSGAKKANLQELVCDLKAIEAKRTKLDLSGDKQQIAAWWAAIEGALDEKRAPPWGYVNCRETINGAERDSTSPGIVASNCDAGFYSGGWQAGWGVQVFDGARDLESIFGQVHGADQRLAGVANLVLKHAKEKAKFKKDASVLEGLKFPSEAWKWSDLKDAYAKVGKRQREIMAPQVKRVKDDLDAGMIDDEEANNRIFDIRRRAGQEASVEVRRDLPQYPRDSGRDIVFWASVLMRDPRISAYLVVQNDVSSFHCYDEKRAKKDWCEYGGYTDAVKNRGRARMMRTIIQAWPELEQQCPRAAVVAHP